MTRLVVLAAAMLFVVGLAYLTLSTVSRRGFSLAGAVSILVLVVLAIGIAGALLNRPRR